MNVGHGGVVLTMNASTAAAIAVAQGGAVDEQKEMAQHGRARKSARSANDSLSLNAYRTKSVSKKA